MEFPPVIRYLLLLLLAALSMCIQVAPTNILILVSQVIRARPKDCSEYDPAKQETRMISRKITPAAATPGPSTGGTGYIPNQYNTRPHSQVCTLRQTHTIPTDQHLVQPSTSIPSVEEQLKPLDSWKQPYTGGREAV